MKKNIEKNQSCPFKWKWWPKGFVAELAPPHIPSAWGSMKERVRIARLATCYKYFSKKKKNGGLSYKAVNREKLDS